MAEAADFAQALIACLELEPDVRPPPPPPLSVAMVDIDRFNRINDVHGHEAGDCVIVEITGALRKSLQLLGPP